TGKLPRPFKLWRPGPSHTATRLQAAFQSPAVMVAHKQTKSFCSRTKNLSQRRRLSGSLFLRLAVVSRTCLGVVHTLVLRRNPSSDGLDAEKFDEVVTVLVIDENVAAARDVINRPGIFQSKLAS